MKETTFEIQVIYKSGCTELIGKRDFYDQAVTEAIRLYESEIDIDKIEVNKLTIERDEVFALDKQKSSLRLFP